MVGNTHETDWYVPKRKETKTMNWYLQNGKESDVVASTRIRIARNLADINFTPKYTKQDANEVIERIKGVLPSLQHGLKLMMLKDIDDLTKMTLVEKHILSPEFVLNRSEIGAILINEEENICIMLNEEDHLRIQVINEGLELNSSLCLALDIENTLSNLLNFAYNIKYGYLTACPTNVGTAIRASVMVHLPALTRTGNIKKVLEVVNKFGMNIRGMYGEGSDTQGDIYQISNKASLGLSEDEIIKNLNIITDKIIEQERLARKYLIKNIIELEDEVYRDFGVLSNARKLSSAECNRLLSSVKLGVDLGIIIELNDEKIKQLELYTKPANLQKFIGRNLDEYERDIERANVVKNIIKA